MVGPLCALYLAQAAALWGYQRFRHTGGHKN